MTKKKLKKLRLQLEAMQRSPSGIAAAALVRIARQLGREEAKRGKEPTYVRTDDPELHPPLSIPGHPGDLKIGTARSIIEQLLSDIDEWEMHLSDDDEDDIEEPDEIDG